ncbi:MAG: type VI secretion protein [Brevundimonas sp. 12-68-7]|uniref:Type VI secretion protein n=1 Tax=Brevundimonas subvibrioides TaxID=74313 RepID=A0A258FJS8_9CAUL|nr:MAG: type VI secretion protein [Brevundimonas sp. 12-68-7]OYX32022.1 MAG: type VI secretion protein [Brevundimonas subvibrioides]
MSVRSGIQVRLDERGENDSKAGRVSLPTTLKSDRINVRTAMFQRLAASRLFAYGDRAGVLRTAQKRSGRAFRLDVRQKVIVKALVSRHAGKGAARAAALAAHVSYLGRAGAGVEGKPAEFYDRTGDAVDAAEATRDWGSDRHHFRFIVSPEHGDRIADLRGYTREVMARVSADLGEPGLRWIGTCHFDTDQPHAHLVVRGKRADGRDLVIPRDYIGFGFRARSQEVAQERLGDLSRADAERRIWKETEADRFTGFDRRLVQAADADGLVEDGVGGTDAWAALSRGRLRHLERLGLAERTGGRYRLDAHMETKLRTLQIRRDVIRTLNQRRMAGARDVRPLGAETVRGHVVQAGRHDEVGASPFVVVKDRAGMEHYARLAPGTTTPAVGKAVEILGTDRGIARLGTLDRGQPTLER